MRYKISIPLVALLVLAVAVSINLHVAAQNQDEEGVRGGFITSRPATVSASVGGSVGGGVNTGGGSGGGGGTTQRRKPRRRPAVAKNTQKSTQTTTASVNANANANASVKAYSAPALGVGYTLYMRDANGQAVRVDPARSFRTGDRVRLLLETNTDGYLYIFNTTDNGSPVMIYPDVRLDDGGNYIEAHVPIEIPSREETDERFQWFTFDNKPGTERLYIVFSREPLPGVPIEDDLVKYCGENGQNCPWRPSAQLWAQVKAGMNARVQVAKSKTYGQAQTSGEADAVNRGVGLTRSAPEPSVIRMNASSTSGLLITVLELAHS